MINMNVIYICNQDLLYKSFCRISNKPTPEPGQPGAQLSELIRLTSCKKAMRAICRWYRTVYISWLVSSYDTHKGKHWLNSDPPNHRGIKKKKPLSQQMLASSGNPSYKLNEYPRRRNQVVDNNCITDTCGQVFLFYL